jgi:cellulose synthase/poly-beta-1,6-N-acetylglucosamine synthase-like glycosyltransferase
VRVSVLITSYQHERYVARALEGVLEQGDAVSFEILVGDDTSTDGSRSIIAEYARARPDRIRTFFPESNLGLDGDDHWTSPAKLARQVRYMDAHPECSMSFHNVVWRHEDGSRPPVPYNSPEQAPTVTMHDLLGANPVASCAALFRREAIHPLPGWLFEQPWERTSTRRPVHSAARRPRTARPEGPETPACRGTLDRR